MGHVPRDEVVERKALADILGCRGLCVLIRSEVIRFGRAEQRGLRTGGQAIGTYTTRSFVKAKLLSSRKRAGARDPVSKRTRDGVLVSPSCEVRS